MTPDLIISDRGELEVAETWQERCAMLTLRLRNANWLADMWRSKDRSQSAVRMPLDMAKRLLWADWAGLMEDWRQQEWRP